MSEGSQTGGLGKDGELRPTRIHNELEGRNVNDNCIKMYRQKIVYQVTEQKCH